MVVSPTPYIPSFIRSFNRYYLYPQYSKDVINYKGTAVVRPPYFKIPNNKFLSLNFKNLSKAIDSCIVEPDSISLIHAHFGQNGIGALRLKNRIKVPLITSFYGYDSGRLSKLFKPYYRPLIENGDIFLALSKDMKKDLINIGFPSEKIVIHHLGIDLNKFNPSLNQNNRKFTFLVVARLDEGKGVQDTINAFNLIHNSNMELIILGDGPYRNKLINLCRKLNLHNKVKFINNFKSKNPRRTVLNHIRKCDVFLLTSFTNKLKSKEGTPVVLMEAQACGKACISTIHAGIPEVVVNNKTGFLVKERDVEGISIKMNLLYNDRKLLKNMGEHACLHIKDNFNHKIQIQRLCNIYTGSMKNDI